MRILTQNCWGVPKKDRKKRFDIIAKTIRDRPYDLVCLQEVFLQRWYNQSFSALDNYHQSYKEGLISLKGGLLTLTKQPAKEVKFHRYEVQGNWFSQQVFDRILGKGFLETIIEDEKTKEDLAVINVHNVSVYQSHYNQKMYLSAQSEQLFEYVKKKIENGKKIILAGDFNFESDFVFYRAFTKVLNDATTKVAEFSHSNYHQKDYIFANGLVKEADEVTHLGSYPSDHPGIYVDVRFKER